MISLKSKHQKFETALKKFKKIEKKSLVIDKFIFKI